MSNNTKSRVEVISKLTAVSSRPTGSGKTHSFTDSDRAMGRYSLHVVFYYKDTVFEDFDLDPIRVSLSDALSLYPPVTGRVVRNGDGRWEVACNDAGVRIVLARVGATLDEWLRSADGAEEEDLTVWEDMPEDPTNWSPFRIQVNEFEGGGTAIGLSCPHMHADLTSLTLLYKSWTDIHLNRPLSHPPLFSPATSPPPSAVPDPDPDPNPPANPKTRTATFKFSHSAVEKCLLEVSGSCPDATPFDFLAALFSSRIARLAERSRSSGSVRVCTDARAARSLPLGLYGNELRFCRVSLGGGEDEDAGSGSGLGWLCQRIHDAVSIVEGPGDGPGRYGPELTLVSMEHLAGDETGPLTFGRGGGGPVHVSYRIGGAEECEGIVVVVAAEAGLGRAVMVSLAAAELGELLEDHAILGLEPVMILSGNDKA